MVYTRIHQEGGTTAAHTIVPRNGKALHINGRFAKKVKHPGSRVPARPYMGVSPDFAQSMLKDPYILGLLRLGG
jgi:phage gpG-like protein